MKGPLVIALVQNDKTKEIVQALQMAVKGKPALRNELEKRRERFSPNGTDDSVRSDNDVRTRRKHRDSHDARRTDC